MTGMRFYYSPSRDHTTFRSPLEFDVPLSEPNDWRPLAVVDPEDREAIERLMREYVKSFGGNAWANDLTDAMQIALREYADPKPSKPAEPTGLGAVVEDADGAKWVRWCLGEWPDRAPWRADRPKPDHRHYDGVHAVRVLSDGVTP